MKQIAISGPLAHEQPKDTVNAAQPPGSPISPARRIKRHSKEVPQSRSQGPPRSSFEDNRRAEKLAWKTSKASGEDTLSAKQLNGPRSQSCHGPKSL